VTYSNASKTRLLGVKTSLLKSFGAVSAEVARAMADGMRERSGTSLALSVTGIAGPTGGTPEKPVGLVYFGLASEAGPVACRFQFAGDRELIRQRAATVGLDLLRRHLLGLSIPTLP
jgi:nicotinamide-nucleotide amidase